MLFQMEEAPKSPVRDFKLLYSQFKESQRLTPQEVLLSNMAEEDSPMLKKIPLKKKTTKRAKSFTRVNSAEKVPTMFNP